MIICRRRALQGLSTLIDEVPVPTESQAARLLELRDSCESYKVENEVLERFLMGILDNGAQEFLPRVTEDGFAPALCPIVRKETS